MIEKIEIQYFRSIYRTTIKGVGDINVLTGKNDVGKSNVLRALNLFINNCIISDGDYNFLQNYNLKRLVEVRKDTIKGKQFIQIKMGGVHHGKRKNLSTTYSGNRKDLWRFTCKCYIVWVCCQRYADGRIRYRHSCDVEK